jgi:hypothetical protein
MIASTMKRTVENSYSQTNGFKEDWIIRQSNLMLAVCWNGQTAIRCNGQLTVRTNSHTVSQTDIHTYHKYLFKF